MPSYITDREMSDRFIPEIKRIVGPYTLEESSLEVDTRQATDLVLVANSVHVACRVRRPGYLQYRNEFTVRSRRDSGAETELSKVKRGCSDWMFYGHCSSERGSDIPVWMLLNMRAFRMYLRVEPIYQQLKFVEKSNHDGTYFIAYDIRSFIRGPRIVIASAGVELNDG